LTYDRVSVDASAEAQIPRDRLSAVLYAQRDGQEAAPLAAEVNRLIDWGVGLAKQTAGIEVQTLDYRTQPVYNKQTLTGWRVRQSIRLTSADFSALGTLVGKLQQRLAVADIGYELSPAGRQAMEDRLIQQAIERFTARAQLVAQALDRPGYRLVSMDIGSGGAPPRPMYRGAAVAMAEAIPSPVLEPGTETVQVRVSGTIELRVQ
jgi:predicted secreted protein